MFPFLFYLFIINNISFLFHDYDWGVVGLCWFGQTSDISEKIKSKADAATYTQKMFFLLFIFVFLYFCLVRDISRKILYTVSVLIIQLTRL